MMMAPVGSIFFVAMVCHWYSLGALPTAVEEVVECTPEGSADMEPEAYPVMLFLLPQEVDCAMSRSEESNLALASVPKVCLLSPLW